MADEDIRQTEDRPITDEIATAEKDIDIFAGYIQRLENPDPTLRSEAKGRGLKLYDEVARDPHAGSVLDTRIMAVVGKDWSIVPGKSGFKDGLAVSTDQDKEIADFVDSVLSNFNFDQARQELLEGILYGFKVGEVMWGIDTDGSVVIRKIIGKHPRRFCFTPRRELRLLTPSNMYEGEPVPERKFIVFTFGDSDNPYGEGLGQSLWWSVWFKKHGIKFWLIFLDKFGQPTIVGKYPPGTPKPKQDDLLDAIKVIHTETGIKIPNNMAIELLEAARSGTASYKDMCEYMDRSISKRVLGQTATTEGTPGKLGNEGEQGDVRQDILEADADLLDACINDTLIPWIVDYNFPGVTKYPKIQTFAGKKPDLGQQSTIDKALIMDLGLPVAADYLYEKYGIPRPEKGQEILSPKTPQNGGGVPGMHIPLPGFSETQRDANGAPETVQMYTEQLEGAAGKYLDAMIDQVRELVMKAHSVEEIRDGLLDLYPDMDALQLGMLMQQALAAAELAGRFDVKEGE